jgi:PilZ domain
MVWVTSQWLSRDLRRAPRVDVLMKVKGELVPVNVPLAIHNLSRTGFAVLSEVAFEVGAPLNFRLVGPNGQTVGVTAEAVHRQAFPAAPGQQLTGFRFVPGRLTGRVPQTLIDQLIDAIVPVGTLI